MIMFIDSEVDESEDEQVSEDEWCTSHMTHHHTRRSSSIFAAPKSLHPNLPLHMQLSSRKP